MKSPTQSMLFRLCGLAVLLFGMTGLVAPVSAAAFIKFDGIDGESNSATHDKWSEIDNVAFGLKQPEGGATGSTRRRGDVILSDIQWNQALDRTFVKLFEATTDGKVFPKVEIDFERNFGSGGPQVFFAMEFKNALMTNLEFAGNSNELPNFAGAFNFEEIKVTYTEFDAMGGKRGNVEASWKVEEGSAAGVAGLFGLALSAPTPVPVPGAVWLFASGLLALVRSRSSLSAA